MTIPAQVQKAIIQNRERFHELNAKAQQRNAQEASSGQKPKVTMGFVTKPTILTEELEFWTIADDEVLDDFLTYDLLGALYGNESINWSELPPGYEPLVLVLEFERHCAFEGWTAISNEGEEDMQRIIAAYRFVGLHDEAQALEAVMRTYFELSDDEDENFDKTLGKAYRSVENATPDEEDRYFHLLGFVRANGTLFMQGC